MKAPLGVDFEAQAWIFNVRGSDLTALAGIEFEAPGIDLRAPAGPILTPRGAIFKAQGVRFDGPGGGPIFKAPRDRFYGPWIKDGWLRA